MKNQTKINSYWQKTYATWDEKTFSWKDKITKPIYKKKLKIHYSPSPEEEIQITGGPIKTKTYLLKHLLRSPSGILVISLSVLNKFPKVWVEWDELEEIIKYFQGKKKQEPKETWDNLEKLVNWIQEKEKPL